MFETADAIVNALGYAALIPVIILVLWGIGRAARSGPYAQFADGMADFNASRAGVPFADRQNELSLRCAAARIRQRASNAVLADPANYHAAIQKVIREESMQLAYLDRDQGIRLANWAGAAPLSDILYADAMKVVWNRIKKPEPYAVSSDMIAAVTVRR